MARSEQERIFAPFLNLPQELRLMIWERALPGPRVVDIRQRKLKKTIGEWEIENDTIWPPNLQVNEESEYDDYEEALVDLQEIRRYSRHQRVRLSEALSVYEYGDDAYKTGHLVGLFSESQPPEILFVCREAFGVASKFYQQAFSSLGSKPQTWFNFDIDTLYLRHDTFSSYYSKGCIGEVVEGLCVDAFRLLDMDSSPKVKKLAILMSEADTGWLLEAWVCDFLWAFGSVEALSLVLKHYQEDGDDQKCLAITEDLVDYEEARAIYESFEPHACGEVVLPGAPPPSIPDLPRLDSTKAGIVKTKLVEVRSDHIEDPGDRWEMPSFAPVVVLTERCRQALETAERECKSRIKASENSLNAND